MKIYKMTTVRPQYTVVPNEFIRRDDLTRRAKAMLIEIMSHADGWCISTEALRGIEEGRDKVRAVLAELGDAGLVKRVQVRQGGGQFGEYVTLASFEPLTDDDVAEFIAFLDGCALVESPGPDLPAPASPAPDLPAPADPSHKKNKKTEEQEQQKEHAAARAREPDRVVELLGVYHDLGRMDATVQQAEAVWRELQRAGLPLRFAIDRLTDMHARMPKAHAVALTRMLLRDIAEEYPPSPVAPGSLEPSAYEVDERTDEEIVSAVGADLVERVASQFLAQQRAADVDTAWVAQVEGHPDPESWGRSCAIHMIRVDGVDEYT